MSTLTPYIIEELKSLVSVARRGLKDACNSHVPDQQKVHNWQHMLDEIRFLTAMLAKHPPHQLPKESSHDDADWTP